MSSIDLPVLENPPPPPPPPSSLVVRYGYLRFIGEFAYDGNVRPGCGAKIVIKTRRGTELAEVLATTCTNSGCPVSLPREQMLSYIEGSGGHDFPFSSEGRVLRVADADDMAEQKRLDAEKPQYIQTCRAVIREMDLPMKLVDVELLLGGEMVTFFFLSEHRVDFRSLVKQLAGKLHTRIQMHQVGSRDEARLVADYETCGQHCCCRQFLKVLRPVNMSSAKMQKATLDPNKISGRCGRLKCCLRYEEQTYDELRRKLPRVGVRVRIDDGIGIVIETAILTQLVKIRLDEDRVVAVANEEILERDVAADAVAPPKAPKPQEPANGGEWRGPRNGSREDRPSGPRPQRQDRPQRPDQPSQRPQASSQPAPEQARIDARNARQGRGRRGTLQPQQPQQDLPSEAPAVPLQMPEPQNIESEADLDEVDIAPSADAQQPQQPAQPPSGQQQPPRGMGSLGRRRRRRRGRGRGFGPGGGTPGPAPEPF